MSDQNENLEVAKRAATPVDVVRAHVESPQFLEQLRRAMPDGRSGVRLVRGAVTALQRNPKLAEAAAANQPSFFAALLTVAQMGLELDGRQCHLVPFFNKKTDKIEVQAIPDYKGLVELVMETGKVSRVHADVVCENDEFDYDMGEIRRHRINLREPRGADYAVYAFAQFKDGSQKAEVLSSEEVESIRKRSRQADSGPWMTDWREMAKKTAFKRLSKWLPLSPEVTEAIIVDNQQANGSDTTVVSAPPKVTPQIPERRQAELAAPEPASGLARRGPGRPRKQAAPPASEPTAPSGPTQEHQSITALRTMASKNGLTEVELCTMAAEWAITEPEAPRASFAEWLPAEADVALQNAVALIEAITETRTGAAEEPA